MNKNSNKANQERFAAMRLAEINATDKEDLMNCASDMKRTASLETNEAVVVAKAIRAKYLPNIARQAGLDVSNLDLNHGKETVDFANDKSDDDDEEDDMEFHHFESDEDSEDTNDDDMSDDDMDDEDEVEDSDDVATFEIEVPADMVDQAQKAVQKALDNLLGGDDDSDEDDDEDITHFNDEESDMDSEDESDDDEDNEKQFIKKSNEVRSMTKQALAERKAQREALIRRAEREEILMKIASEEETYPASASFKYNEDMVDMSGQVEYPSMTMQGSESNSLKGQNPTWAEQKVPTMNPGSLQFPSVTTPGKFEGSGDGSLEYTVDWEHLETPSEGLEDAEQPQIPTQMSSMPHKASRSVAASKEDEEKHDCECTSCGKSMRLTEAEMNNTATRCSKDDCPSNQNVEDEDDMARASANEINKPQKTQSTNMMATAPSGAKIKMPIDVTTTTQLASLDLARIKTSYSCATKLALAGIITSEEVDSYAEQMINDGLKSDSMIRQTKLLLKSAQSSTERVVAAAAERMSTRTASTLGVSTSPALSGGLSNNSAALDIQGALRGTWTMPKIED